MITSTSFDSSASGFTAKGSAGATYSATLQNGELLVKAKEAWGGVRRTITNTAKAGDRYKIRVLADRGTTDVVRLFLAEGGDPTTPQWSTYGTQYLQPGVQLIEFLYTVTETGSLSLQLDKTDASELQGTETNFKLLEAKIEKIGLDVLEENNYYAFGMKHQGYNNVVTATDPALKYKYNGKELQDELGLGWYDYGARNYDPSLGRWFNVDPLAEQLYNNTPYNYVSNNPMNFIDPDGRSGIGTLKKDKNGKEYLEISSKMYFYGSKASKQQAIDTAKNIQDMWNKAGGKVEIDGKKYDVRFNISGEYVSEKDAEKLAKGNGSNAENNFVRVEDGSQLAFKSSFYDTPGNSGYFIDKELKNGSTDAHEYGHGLGWYEAGEADGGRHDATVDNGVPGIMSPRGTPVSDQYGYGGQPSGQKTMSPYRRGVLASDITKLNIDTKTLKTTGTVNVGTATNNIYNANGTKKP